MMDDRPSLHVYCHISGGLVFGSAQMREAIFRREMPLVLEAIRHGDSKFFERNPGYDNASIIVHFQKSGKDIKIERFGVPSDYARVRSNPSETSRNPQQRTGCSSDPSEER
jgi:hypothetical protein